MFYCISTKNFTEILETFSVDVIAEMTAFYTLPTKLRLQPILTWKPVNKSSLDAASDQALHCLLAGFSIRNQNKRVKLDPTPLK